MEGAVSLIRVKDPKSIKHSISQALDSAGFRFKAKAESVIVKPNLCYYWDATTGYTTDPRIVGAIIDLVRDTFGDVEIQIAEADASAMRTRHVFPVLGYDKLAKEKNVELLNLSNDILEDRTAQVQGRQISFKIPQTLLKSDLFINVPKLKVMRATKITCAMKNIFGCMGAPRKVAYHPFLNEAIVGMNKIVHPHLTIVDGLVALGQFPKKLNLLMAGTDTFSVDWIASQIAGYNPSRVSFLKIALKEKLGHPENITVIGDTLEEFRKEFPKHGFLSSNYSWGIQFWLLKTYQRLTGDVIPPLLEEA